MKDYGNGNTGKKAKSKRRETALRDFVKISAKEITNDSDIVVPHQICVYMRQPLPHDACQPTEDSDE